MKKHLVLMVLFAFLVGSVTAQAEVSVVQDYCEQLVEGSYDQLIIHFSVINFNLPSPLCAISVIPEPQPPLAECEVTGSVAPVGYSTFLNPFGGADYFAHTPGDCIGNNTMLQGFQIVVGNPDFCCYVVQFMDPTGAVILEQEECFNCTVTPEEETTWGSIKSMYR